MTVGWRPSSASNRVGKWPTPILISNYGHPSSVGSQSLSIRLLPHIETQGGAQHIMIYLWVLGPITNKPSLLFVNWGFICLIGWEMLWHCVESCFCMRWESGWEERGSVSPTIWRTKCMNGCMFLILLGPWNRTTCLLLENRLGIQPENVFWSYINDIIMDCQGPWKWVWK